MKIKICGIMRPEDAVAATEAGTDFVGMIFVPSLEGISHSPLEMTGSEQITAGANVLLRSLLAVDEGEP